MKKNVFFTVSAIMLIGNLCSAQSTKKDIKILKKAIQEVKKIQRKEQQPKEMSSCASKQCSIAAALCSEVPSRAIKKIRTDILHVPKTESFDDWHHAESLGPITRLKLWYGNVLNNIQAGYQEKWLAEHSKIKARAQRKIKFPEGDPLVKISGVYGRYFGATHLAQVVFTLRSGKQYGPFGDAGFMTELQPFTLGGHHHHGHKQQIVALCGGSFLHSDHSKFLSSLGVYLKRS